MTCSCSIYGLGVQVNVPIAGLAGLKAARRVDVRICFGAMPPFLAKIAPAEWRNYHLSSEVDEHGESVVRVLQRLDGEYFHLAYADGTVIAVDKQGSRVWATSPDTATVEDTATYLLGPVLGFVLRLRGTTCLHASAMVVGDRAIAMVGPSGSGKSTLAAVFAGLGHDVLTDDVLALVDAADSFGVQPAYPRVRLWPEAVEALFGSKGSLPRISPGWDKRYLDLNGPPSRFHRDALPLGLIYILDDCGAEWQPPRIEPLSPRDGLMSLVANTFTTYLLDKRMRAQEFEFLGRLVKEVPVRRVIPGGGVGQLPTLCRLITEDCLQFAAG